MKAIIIAILISSNFAVPFRSGATVYTIDCTGTPLFQNYTFNGYTFDTARMIRDDTLFVAPGVYSRAGYFDPLGTATDGTTTYSGVYIAISLSYAGPSVISQTLFIFGNWTDATKSGSVTASFWDYNVANGISGTTVNDIVSNFYDVMQNFGTPYIQSESPMNITSFSITAVPEPGFSSFIALAASIALFLRYQMGRFRFGDATHAV
ncbi:MAG: hypothetical protein ABSD57_04845 [Verrucomicrobiota bacterium]|jgi:hypothetical protein